jgi:hypothetical protein
MVKRVSLLAAVLVVSATLAGAEGRPRPLASHVTWKSLYAASEPLRVPVQDKPAQLTVDLPALPCPRGQVLALRFRAWLYCERPGGWNNLTAVALNGRDLTRTVAGGTARVLNRKSPILTSLPNESRLNVVQDRNGRPALQTFFGPGTVLDDRVLTEREEDYWYLLDLTDLARGDQPNQLELTNLATKDWWGGNPPPGSELVFADLAIGLIPGAQAEALRQEQLTQRMALPGTTLKAGNWRLTVPAGGGLQLETGGDRYFVESSFSFPGKTAPGENRLACLAKPEGERGWKPQVTVSGKALVLTAAGATYSLRRRVVPEGKRVLITDAVTNRTNEVLGLHVGHGFITAAEPRTKLANGLDDAGHGPGTYPENPTIFAATARTGLGLLAEDDALRLRSGTSVQTNELRLETSGFAVGLAPGETYTFRWALYPGSPDYWDFINQVRRDWQTNFTVEGPWDFFSVGALETEAGRERARQMLQRKHLKWAALAPWFEYYSGWTYDRAQYKTMMVQAMRTLREMQPDLKFMALVETNLVPVPLSFFQGTIPADWPLGRDKGGQYGQAGTPEMTAIIKASRWKDSCLYGKDGNVRLDSWYIDHYRSKPAINLMVYPTLDNHRHAQAMEQFAWLLDDVGFDGLYIDQFSLAFGSADRYTYDRWDGRTVELDATGRVSAKLADLGLLSAPARRQWVEMVLKRGKKVVCNSNAATSVLQGLPAWRFMETQGYDPLAGDKPSGLPHMTKGQLGSPLGLGSAGSTIAAGGAPGILRTVITQLRYGLLYYYYSAEMPTEGPLSGEYGPINHMFPFTPVELHEGWVLGRERLITAVSGKFAWPYERRPKVLQFDDHGRARPATVTVTKAKVGYTVSLKLRDWWEIAVVE